MKRDMKRTTERDLLIAGIERDVAALVRRRDHERLYDVLEHTGFISNSNEGWTVVELGNAIVGLARAVDLFWLRATAEGAAFARAKGDGGSWDDAQRAATRARLLPRLKNGKPASTEAAV